MSIHWSEMVDAMYAVNMRAQKLVELSSALLEEISRLDQDVRGLATMTGVLADIAPKVKIHLSDSLDAGSDEVPGPPTASSASASSESEVVDSGLRIANE
jgi:hypothetical protein